MPKILVVEDDPILARSVQMLLESESLKPAMAPTLRVASQHLESDDFDLIVLDLNLPDGSGLDLVKSLRDQDSRVPVLILTAKTDEDTIVQAFRLGTNDFVKKPFSNRELMARIQGLLRKAAPDDRVLRLGALSVNLNLRSVQLGERTLHFNRREFDIFVHLLQNKDRVVTRDKLLEKIDREEEIFDRTIDSHISHIRAHFKKMNVHSMKITSIYGVGYRLETIGHGSEVP